MLPSERRRERMRDILKLNTCVTGVKSEHQQLQTLQYEVTRMYRSYPKLSTKTAYNRRERCLIKVVYNITRHTRK